VSLINLSASACLAPSSAVTTVRSSKCYIGWSARNQIWGQTLSICDRTIDPAGPDQAHRSGGPSRRRAQIWGQTRCPVYRSGTFNAQSSTLNFQRGDRKGAWWARYGDRHEIWTTGLLTRWTCPSAGRVVPAGCGAQIWGQTRCPIYRSGTFNVKRSTLNF